MRYRVRIKKQRLREIEIKGIEHLQEALSKNQGILITPNHPGHADPLALCEVADQLNMPFYFMAAWQVFEKSGWFKKFLLRHHGCFSIDREGTDMRAFRQALDILQHKANPLVIFPEGEVYHCNDKITPFREGPAVIALTAAKHANRPVVCIPCGIKYQYLSDPTEELVKIMSRLEERILWRPRPDLPLDKRIYRFAEGALALKELEYLGRTQVGVLPHRIKILANKILGGLEGKYDILPQENTIPERIKTARKAAIKKMADPNLNEYMHQQACIDLEDLFVVVQLFSYPGDYVSGKPTIERMAETLDKFEEDVFRVSTATIRGMRKAVIVFADPIVVESIHGKTKSTAHLLTQGLENSVQSILDAIEPTRILGI